MIKFRNESLINFCFGFILISYIVFNIVEDLKKPD